MEGESAFKGVMMNEFKKVNSMDQVTHVTVTDETGEAMIVSKEDLKAFLGTVQTIAPKALAPTDPAPSLSGLYYPTVTQNESGTPIVYTNAGGIEVNTAEGGEDYGKQVQLIFDGTDWAKVDIPVPIQDISNLATKEEVDKKADTVDILEKEEYTNSSSNYISKRTLVSGHWVLSGGNLVYSESVNWLSARGVKIPEVETITISGAKADNMTSDQPRVVWLDSDKEVISHSVGNNQAVQTFERPVNAVYMDTSIANVIDIGIDPSVNQYADSIMLNAGGSALPYEPYDNKIKPEKIDFDFEEIVQEDSLTTLREMQEWVTEESSYNLIDKHSDITAGHWLLDGGGQPYKSTSVNWISTNKIFVNDPEELDYYLQGLRGSSSSGGANGRLFFWNESNEFHSLVTFDQTGRTLTEFSVNPPIFPFYIAINVANVVGIGNDPVNNEYSDTLQLNKGTKLPYRPGGSIKKISSQHIESTGSEVDTDKVIIVKPTLNSMTIFFYTGGNTFNWFGVSFVRTISPAKFVDVWRLDEAKIYQRMGEYEFLNVLDIVANGVWENALYTDEPQYTDALGSAHGHEMMQSVSFYLDGSSQLLGGITGNFKANELLIQSVSNFVTSDGATVRGTSTKTWKIVGGKITVSNNILFKNIPTNFKATTYIAMCSILRTDSSGKQITNRAMRNLEWQNFNVSSPGFTNVLNSERVNAARTIVIEGDRIKLEMVIQKATPSLTGRGFWVQNSDLYNKLYFQFGEVTAQAGDVWEVETDYIFQIK